MAEVLNPLAKFVRRVNKYISKSFDKIGQFSDKKVILFLFLFTFTISAPMLIGFGIDNDPTREKNKDIQIFRDRAQTLSLIHI